MYNSQDNSEKIIYIPINSIKPNPYQPRKFIETTSVSDLAESIKNIGLLEPLKVRKLRSGTYELVSGERRLRASEMAGLTKVGAVVLDISDDLSAVYTLADNIQRKEITYFEKAFAFYHLIFEHGISKKELSVKIGVRESEISKKLSLCKLSTIVRNIITENKLSEEYAHILLKVESEEKRIMYLKKCIEKEFTPEEFENYIFNPEQTVNKKNKVKIKIKDYAIVFNTLKKAVELMKNGGVRANLKRHEHNSYYEYIIKIEK